MSAARLICLMGSGETSPTMVKVHRDLLARVGDGPAVLLDTPYGFQENAADISARAVRYFRDSVGATMEPLALRRLDGDPVDVARSLELLRAARYVFAGPGSPTYALAQWEGSTIPDLLAATVETGGGVTFASAAALTLGAWTVPVYEIYKVGQEPTWLAGLDLLGRVLGLRVAVIPHFDNAEGGNHDTRFCYLGERRLSMLEASLPEDAFVLGIDEHTALVIDLEAATATVAGNGTVTIRVKGVSRSLPSGTTLPLHDLPTLTLPTPTSRPVDLTTEVDSPPVQTSEGMGLLGVVERAQGRFDAAIGAGDAQGAATAALELEAEVQAWQGDTLQSDEMDRARAALRGMIVRLADAAAQGLGDPREVVGPFIEALLIERASARDEQRWDAADRLRDTLNRIGVDVRDGPDGSTWDLPAAPR